MELGVGTYTALTDPGANGKIGSNASYAWIRQLIVLRRRGKPSGIRSPIWMPMMGEA